MQDYIDEAIRQQLTAYGFSSHSPIPYKSAWSMPAEKMEIYSLSIDLLKQQHKDKIEIYKALEVDYIPGVSAPDSQLVKSIQPDYTIGSVHFIDFLEDGMPWEIDGSNEKFEEGFRSIFKGDIEAVIRRYFALTREMVSHHSPTIVGHLDKIKIQNHYHPYFTGNENFYKEEIQLTLDCIAASNCMVEVNTRGLYKKKSAEVYPGIDTLRLMHERNIPVVINSDAHIPKEITLGYDVAIDSLEIAGYKSSGILSGGAWTNIELKELKKHLNTGI
jgi:histidinol-phosphatase (PHP family)